MRSETMEDQRRGKEYEERSNDQDCGGLGKRRFQEEPSAHGKPQARGFVHVLWLLVILTAFLFGATVVNIVIGIRACETSTRQNAAIETLTLSVREVRKSVLYLAKTIEETFQAEEEYDSDEPSEEGRI
jgi:hypothetical protein